jgi:hypothetical protein
MDGAGAADTAIAAGAIAAGTDTAGAMDIGADTRADTTAQLVVDTTVDMPAAM